MPRRVEVDDDWSDDFDPDDDFGEDEGTDTRPCPYCRKPILEDTPRCPYCEHYISEEDAPISRKPWWIVIGVLLCLFVIYGWIMGGN